MSQRKVRITNTGYLPNSPDRHNPMNIIPSNQITMDTVPFPILGVDNLGNKQMMMPGMDYTFPGQYVTEIPMGKYQKGGNNFKTKLSAKDEEQFKKFFKTLPDNLRADDSMYDIRGYWDASGRPKEFDYSQPTEEDGYYHAFSRHPETGKILKAPTHPTFKYAVDKTPIGDDTYVPVIGIDGNVYMRDLNWDSQRVFEEDTYKYQKGRQVVFTDPEEFKKANQAYADSSLLYDHTRSMIKDLKTYENLYSGNVLGGMWSQYATNWYNTKAPILDPAFIRLTKANKKSPQPDKTYASKVDNNQVAVQYKKPETIPVLQEAPTRIEPLPIQKLPVNIQPGLEPYVLPEIKGKKTTPIMQASYAHCSGQYQTGENVWNEDKKKWERRMFKDEEADWHRNNGRIKRDGGLVEYQKKGEVLSSEEIRNEWNRAASQYIKDLYRQLDAEKERVAKVRANVPVAAKQLDEGDNFRHSQGLGEDLRPYQNYLGAKNPKELEAARQALSPRIKNLLINQGKYNVAQWDASKGTWNPQATPARELYCTPYGCFTYQLAGATDVPIVSGNMGFVDMVKTGKLPFEKVSNPEEGDMGILVGAAPKVYTKPELGNTIRPHHTVIYDSTDANGNVNAYNAYDGSRLNYTKTNFQLEPSNANSTSQYMDYYRYVGNTKKLQNKVNEALKSNPKLRELEEQLKRQIELENKDALNRIQPLDMKPIRSNTSTNVPELASKKYGGLTHYQKKGQVDPNTNPNQDLTYKNNPEWFDNRAIYSGNDKYDAQIRKLVYEGRASYNPATKVMTFLKPNQQTKVDQTTKTLSKDKRTWNEQDKKTVAKVKEDATKMTPEKARQYIVDNQKDFVQKSALAAGALAAPFAAPAVMGALEAPMVIAGSTIPGVTVGSTIGALGAGYGITQLPNTWNTVGRAVDDPTTSSITDAATAMGINALDFVGLGIGKATLKGAKNAGRFLTTETPLKNAYKYNPWAFKSNPEAYYRMLGKEGLRDAAQSGVIRANQRIPLADNGEPFGGMTSPEFDAPYFSKSQPWDKAYEGPYMVQAENVPMIGRAAYPETAYVPENTLLTNNPNLKFYKQDWLRGYKPVEVPKVLPGSANPVPIVNTAKNLEELTELEKFARTYGYDFPSNLERIAQSDELTNRTFRGLLNRHNTFARGVSTNWAEIEKRNPEILRHLEGKGFDLSTEEGSKAAAEYMATHIPISTGYGRADLSDEVFARGMEGLYTSNSLPTAEGYTYGNGFMVKTKRPTDFSSSNRLDWIEHNNPQYYDERLPKLGLPKNYDAETLRKTTVDDLSKALENGSIDKETYSNLIHYKTEGEKEIRQALREKYNFKEGEDIPDEYLDDYMDDLYSMRNEKLKELFPTKAYDRKILRTERSKLPADAYDFLLKKNDGSLKKMQEHLKARPYQDKMQEVHDLGMSLTKYTWEEQQPIRDRIKVLEQEAKDMFNQDVQNYMKENHPDYEPVNRYAHYIHLGTPGEKVLEPIQSWRITPEIWANKSRGHRNTYTKKFSAMQMGGDTDIQKGGIYLGKYEFKNGGLVKAQEGKELDPLVIKPDESLWDQFVTSYFNPFNWGEDDYSDNEGISSLDDARRKHADMIAAGEDDDLNFMFDNKRHTLSNQDKLNAENRRRQKLADEQFQKDAEEYAKKFIHINDPRKIRLTSGKPINPNVDLVTKDYDARMLHEILKSAKQQGLSKEDALNAAAIGFQESGWGSTDGNIGHVTNMNPEADPISEMIWAYLESKKTADRLKFDDPDLRLQVYNGTGTIKPETEQKYHGFKMKKIYGVPVPAEGLNMKEHKLYGKQIRDIRDNVLLQNPSFTDIFNSYYPSKKRGGLIKKQEEGSMRKVKITSLPRKSN